MGDLRIHRLYDHADPRCFADIPSDFASHLPLTEAGVEIAVLPEGHQEEEDGSIFLHGETLCLDAHEAGFVMVSCGGLLCRIPDAKYATNVRIRIRRR